MKRQLAERQGRKAERWAALWLRLKGWSILAERVKTQRGEIDLVCRRAGIVAFIEVKFRSKAAQLDHAIDAHRLRRVAAAAECVAHEYVRNGDDMRIDVILLAPGAMPHHITNAWQP